MIMDPVSRNYIIGEIEGCMYMRVRMYIYVVGVRMRSPKTVFKGELMTWLILLRSIWMALPSSLQ